MADSGGGRSCGVCKRTLQPGDEWIALDGGEIWCAECWQKRFPLPTAGSVGAAGSGASAGTAPAGRAAGERCPCMECGHLCAPDDAICPECGGAVAPATPPWKAAPAPRAPGDDLAFFDAPAQDLEHAGGHPHRSPVPGGVGTTPPSPPYVATVQGPPGSLSVGSGSPVVHQINIGAMPAAVAASPGKTSGMAVASFVLSLVGIFCFGFVTGLLALILGAVAMRATSREPALRGRGLAVAGFIIGIIDVIGWLVWLVIYLDAMQRFHF